MKKLSYLTIIFLSLVMAAQSRKINSKLKNNTSCFDEGRQQGL
jgi:hypothetical protein